MHNEKLQRNANISEQNDFFSTCFVQFFIPLSWNHLLSEQGRRFSKEDEKFTLKKNFFVCFRMLKALCHEICFWAFGEDNM